MSYEFCYDEFTDPKDEDVKKQWTIQDSIVFLVDGTQQMYESGSMQKCLEAYNKMVRSKCSFNKKDKLGLIIFGTKDTNCKVDNITLLQNFEPVSVDTLKNIQSVLNGGINKYEEQALNANEKYPLYNAIEYAFQVANSSKTDTVSHRIVILCTCKDDPPVDDRRRIEHLVATFKDVNTELCVIGLTDLFDDGLFYKELQVISGSYKNDNYVQMCLKDLEESLLSLARTVGRLPWKISNDCIVEVSMQNLVSFPKYPPKVKVNKNTNEVLETRTVMREEGTEQDPELDDTEEPGEGSKKVIASDEDTLVYYKKYAFEDIHFKKEECKLLKNGGLEPGIAVLAFKPIVCDPMFHYKNTYFVSCRKTANEDSRNFFRTFVSRCIAKDVMAICKVITATDISICNMVPSDEDGGFYMFKIPFNNVVRDYDMLLETYRYDDENKCPLKEDAVVLFHKLTKVMEIKYSWDKFTNPKLDKYIAHLEALALDKVLSSLPPDNTRPPPVSEKLKNLRTALMNMLELRDIESAKKRPLSQKPSVNKRSKPDVDVPTLARENKLDSLTVLALKAYLEGEGISAKGTKFTLIQAVKKHLGI